jgi:hypothetical protein
MLTVDLQGAHAADQETANDDENIVGADIGLMKAQSNPVS